MVQNGAAPPRGSAAATARFVKKWVYEDMLLLLMDICILFINFSLSSCFVSSLIGGGGGGGGGLVSVTSPCHLTWVLAVVFIGFCMVIEFHLNGS